MSGTRTYEKPEVLGSHVWFLTFPENSFFLMLLQAVLVNRITSAASLAELLPLGWSQPAVR